MCENEKVCNENRMCINITAKDYFNELKLMEEQYGQEEDLYPWIYMLLQMAECKKREVQGDNYKSVSIRDIHDMNDRRKNALVLSDNQRRIRSCFEGKGGYPDLAVLCKNGNTLLGCVEIKPTFDFKNKKISELKDYILFDFNKEYKIINKLFIKSFVLNFDEKDKTEIIKSVLDNRKFRLKEKENEFAVDGNDLCDIPEFQRCSIKSISWDFDSDPPLEGDYRTTLIGHIEHFRKTIFTNGLEFYFFTIMNGSIKIKKIADLRKAYNKYKNCTDNDGSEEIVAELYQGDISKSEVEETDGEWTKLIKGLANNINWHEEPTVKITNTEKEKE